MIELAIVLAIMGSAGAVWLLAGRAAAAKRWRKSLTALSVRFPRDVTEDAVRDWLAALAAIRSAVAVEIMATRESITHYLLVPEGDQAAVLARTQVLIPGVRLQDAPEYLRARPGLRAAADFRLTSLSRTLSIERTAAMSAALLSALTTVQHAEAVRVQVILSGLPTPRPRSTTDPARELITAERAKHRQPLMGMTVRVGVAAQTTVRARALLRSITGTLRLLDAPAVRLVRRYLPTRIAAARLTARSLPLTVWPVVANASEAASLIGVQFGAGLVPGLVTGRARQLPPGRVPAGGGSVLADSNYPGMAGRPLVIRPQDRLRHLYLLGPTGSGKSTLITNLAIADAAAGSGLFLIDPKGDLVENILERLPDHTTERVVVIDPSQTAQPIGFNPLAVTRGADELRRELVADQVLHVFRDLYRSYWGPRTDDVLRAALQTLTSVPAPNGQPFALTEVAELLSSPALRRYVTARPDLPPLLRDYWRVFDGMSEGERLQFIGPVNNKLRAFTMRSTLRLMLGQSQGLDLAAAMRRRQIVLVSLAKGRIGTEASQLIGSLLVAAFWESALERVNIPPEKRRPYYLYVDEFQDVVRMSDGLADLLSQARGLGVGAVLANQYLAQLSPAIQTAVLGTVRSQLTFQIEYDDARLLERRFAPALTAADLSGLDAYEAALRAYVGGDTAAPVTGRARPLGPVLREAAVLAEASRAAFGQSRADVEAALEARLGRSQAAPFGRRSSSGGAE